MRRYYIIKEGDHELRRVYQTVGDRWADMGKWGWNAVRFHLADTDELIWIRKYWMVDVIEEKPAKK